MDEKKLINRASFVVAGFTTLVSFLLFYFDTNEALKSFGAALITGSLVFATYMVLRWLVLAYKS